MDSPITTESEDVASILRAVEAAAATLAAFKVRIEELERYETELHRHADSLLEANRRLQSQIAALQAEQDDLSRSVETEAERAKLFEAFCGEQEARIPLLEHELSLERNATASVVSAVSKAFGL